MQNTDLNLDKPLKILVIQRQSHVSRVPFSRSVCARVTEPLSFLAFENKVIWNSVTEEGASEADITSADIVFFSKHVSNRSVELSELAKSLGKPTIYDIDDWILSFPSYSGANISQEKLDNFAKHMALSTVVTVANHRLQELLKPYRNDLKFVPNGFWIEKYTSTKPNNDNDILKFVFTNADNLKIKHFKNDFLAMLREILDKYPNVQFDFFGDTDVEMQSVKDRMNYLGSINYDEHKIKLLKNRYGFAIVPLGGEDDPDSLLFNSCKNPFKYLEYGGVAVPAIFSKSPIYEDVITNGENGIIVENSADAWFNAMEIFINNHSLRKQMGSNAYDDVMQKHHIRFSAEAYMKIFLSLVR